MANGIRPKVIQLESLWKLPLLRAYSIKFIFKIEFVL